MTTRPSTSVRWARPHRLVVAALATAALGGCVYAPPPPPVVPAPVVEVVPPPPFVAAVWRRGHWRWNGFRYVWIPGHYVTLRG